MPRTFDALSKPYPPHIQALAHQARDFVLDLMADRSPSLGAGDVIETIDGSGPYAFYGYAPGYKGLVCSLILSKTEVKLGLSHGASLDDPRSLLKGAGKVHRHIPLKTSADLKKAGVKALVKAAIKQWRARTSA